MSLGLTAPQESGLRSVGDHGYFLVTKMATSQAWNGSSWVTDYKEYGQLTWASSVGSETSDGDHMMGDFKPKKFKFRVITLGWNVAAELQNKGLVYSHMDKKNRMMQLCLTELGRITYAKLGQSSENGLAPNVNASDDGAHVVSSGSPRT